MHPKKRPDTPDHAEHAPTGDPVGPAAPGSPATGDPVEPAPAPDASLDTLRRLQAEFENYRKRSDREIASIRARAAEDLVADLLPTLDHLDKALLGPTPAEDPLRQGIELIRQEFSRTLQRHGLETIAAANLPFDTFVHEALQIAHRTDVEPGTVVEVHRPGYALRGHVLRAAQVTVSAAPPRPAEETPTPPADERADADSAPPNDPVDTALP